MPTDDPARPFPFHAPELYEPPAEFDMLRRECPVARVELPTGDRAWLVTRYADVKRVLSDPVFSRAAAARPGAPRLRPLPPDSSTILAMDPPEHSRLRRLVTRAFAPRRIDRLRPRVQAIVDGLVDAAEAAGPPADLVSALALPLPVTVIGELLGVPPEDLPRFRGWADAMLTLTGHSADEVRAARTAMNEYLAELIAERRRAPEDDLLSVLIAARDEEERLTERELVIFAATLLIAGYHTTSTAITAGAVVLFRQPAMFTSAADRPELVPQMVNEVLRYAVPSTHGSNMRVATEPVELGGVPIQPGDGVLAAIVSADRDPSVFADADRFCPERGDDPHLAFGHGPHFCLGAQLARTELEVVFATLARRLPGLRLAVPEDELKVEEGALFRRLEALPVTWSR